MSAERPFEIGKPIDVHVSEPLPKIEVPKEEIQPITVLGVDQSTTATGLCVVRWHPVSGPDVLYARTVEPSGMIEIHSALWNAMCYGQFRPVAMAREQGFFSSKTPEAGLSTERSGGWVEMALHRIVATIQDVPIAQYRVMAIEWRRVVWGPDEAKLPTELAKEHSIRFFKAHVQTKAQLCRVLGSDEEVWIPAGGTAADAVKITHDMADAFGIGCWCGQHHYNLTLEGGPG